MNLHGRRTIYTGEKEVNAENVIKVLEAALVVHKENVQEIDYLRNYRRGMTEVLKKVKDVRPEINNKVNENHAEEIMTFWTGYSYGEPLQYVRRNPDSDDVDVFNDCMHEISKASKDAIMEEWLFECGVAYLVVLPSEDELLESPFDIFAPDPRDVFVIYRKELEDIPVAFVYITLNSEAKPVYSVYTKDRYYEVEDIGHTQGELNTLEDLEEGLKVRKDKAHLMKAVPGVEFSTRIKMGMFELVLPILDAINTLQSNRIDDVVQFVQSFMKATGMAKLDEEEEKKFKRDKMIYLPEGADIDIVAKALDQAGVQTLKDDLYNAMLTICCMPNRNGGTSTSDTGIAVVYRDGWSAAETKAKIIDLFTDKSEKRVIALCVHVLNKLRDTKLKVSDIDIKHTRRNYEALTTKTQALTEMLKTDKIHPELAFTHCGLFTDPATAYKMSHEYYEKTMNESLNKILKDKGYKLIVNDKGYELVEEGTKEEGVKSE